MRFDYAQYGKSMVMHVSMTWPNKGFQMSFDPIPKFTLYAIEEMTNNEKFAFAITTIHFGEIMAMPTQNLRGRND